MLDNENRRKEFRTKVADHRLEICALNCSGNQLAHQEYGRRHDEVVRKTFRFAELLDIHRIVMMSGLPGGPAGRPSGYSRTVRPASTEILPGSGSARARTRPGIIRFSGHHFLHTMFAVSPLRRAARPAVRRSVGKRIGKGVAGSTSASRKPTRGPRRRPSAGTARLPRGTTRSSDSPRFRVAGEDDLFAAFRP